MTTIVATAHAVPPRYITPLEKLILRVAVALPSLSYRERETLKLRYAISDGHVYTTAEVGRILLNKDARHARDVERRALRKLEKIDPALTADALRGLRAAACAYQSHMTAPWKTK